MIQSANDPTTIALLQGTGIQPGWTCLELGPGAGSILRWLGEQVEANRMANGIDKNTTYLQVFSVPPYDMREENFLDVSINHTLDLAHARYVLIHSTKSFACRNRVAWRFLRCRTLPQPSYWMPTPTIHIPGSILPCVTCLWI
jgi:hypothetical protein